MPRGGFSISPDEKVWTLQMRAVSVIDQPRWPAINARATRAFMDFKLVWTATDERALYDDPDKRFRVEGYRATAQLEAKVTVPALGFSWKSDPLNRSEAAFAVIGHEVNGRYYDAWKAKAKPDGVAR